MPKRLRYTVMSRAKTLSQVGIVEGAGLKWGPLERVIDSKIRGIARSTKRRVNRAI